jgi:CheY-like chemotaxis protein
VTALNGEITVTSEEGRGSTFRVVLPPATQPIVTVTPSLRPRRAAEASAAVLVVDDEPAVGSVLRRVLREHQVTVVTQAKQALELLSLGEKFDVILSDLMMPEMSGMEFYDEVLQRFPALAPRMVFVSGGAFTPVADAFLERVSNELIDKPFDAHRVREIVARLMR